MSGACSYGEERLAGLLYDDGDDIDNREMRAHLATCAGCRAELDGLGSMKDLLAAWPNVVNAPRMIYVNESSGVLARLRRWAGPIVRPGIGAALKPAAAMATVVLVLLAAAALLDVRVAPDGRVQLGFASGPAGDEPIGDVAKAAAEAPPVSPVSREELAVQLTQVVAEMEELLRSRSDAERQLLMAAIDERMEEQGLAMSRQLRGAVDAAFTDVQQQHEGDLGLVFSAIDELGVIAGSELQRMNTILASLLQRDQDDKE